MVSNLRQMTLDEIKQQVEEATGNDWRVNVRLMPTVTHKCALPENSALGRPVALKSLPSSQRT